jgi:hypothetical protein
MLKARPSSWPRRKGKNSVPTASRSSRQRKRRSSHSRRRRAHRLHRLRPLRHIPLRLRHPAHSLLHGRRPRRLRRRPQLRALYLHRRRPHRPRRNNLLRLRRHPRRPHVRRWRRSSRMCCPRNCRGKRPRPAPAIRRLRPDRRRPRRPDRCARMPRQQARPPLRPRRKARVRLRRVALAWLPQPRHRRHRAPVLRRVVPSRLRRRQAIRPLRHRQARRPCWCAAPRPR